MFSDMRAKALGSCAVAALLAACGGLQPLIGASGATPQGRTVPKHSDRDGSWMLPEAKHKNLLYVADAQNYNVSVYSYPDGALVGELSVYNAWAACAGYNGNVFISSEIGYRSEILEYKHGGKDPVAVLQDGDSAYFPSDCSVDPTTGNLAVANVQGYYGRYYGNVALYASAQGPPRFLTDDSIPYIWSSAYDGKGNLYVDGSSISGRLRFAKINHGESKFRRLTLHADLCCQDIPLIWKNDRLDVAAGLTVYEFKMNRRSGHETQAVALSAPGVNRFAINKDTFVGSAYDADAVYLWHYPSGGNPYRTITQGLSQPEGVAISMAR